ncbi:hypothetical protein GWC77_24175 [Paraburkholderia sp. NMBU_R16]|uniref:hypothetical protein n=1 Tax=Paraburkholderia sp. NMBU_R16 TaxID=2698676 RepID=UPI0015668983|nr:hypothetical protein [Paraburkholderia sp. NMBU_R16]NRO99008.1 hypothetical protein [Paraburkholderia sp. NMBU_R16]
MAVEREASIFCRKAMESDFRCFLRKPQPLFRPSQLRNCYERYRWDGIIEHLRNRSMRIKLPTPPANILPPATTRASGAHCPRTQMPGQGTPHLGALGGLASLKSRGQAAPNAASRVRLPGALLIGHGRNSMFDGKDVTVRGIDNQIKSWGQLSAKIERLANLSGKDADHQRLDGLNEVMLHMRTLTEDFRVKPLEQVFCLLSTHRALDEHPVYGPSFKKAVNAATEEVAHLPLQLLE